MSVSTSLGPIFNGTNVDGKLIISGKEQIKLTDKVNRFNNQGLNVYMNLSSIINVTAYPYAYDINADGKYELIFPMGNKTYLTRFYNETVLEVLWELETGIVEASPFISDYDGDGASEIFIMNKTGHLYVVNSTGSVEREVSTNISPSQIQGYDINGDGALELIVFGKNNNLYYLTMTGDYGPFTLLAEGSAYGIYGYPLIYDDDGDNKLSIITLLKSITGTAFAVALTSNETNWALLTGRTTLPILKDVTLEPIFGNLTTDSTDSPQQNPYEMGLFLGKNQVLIVSIVGVSTYIEANFTVGWNFSSINPMTGDIDGDSQDEIIVVDENGTIHAMKTGVEIWQRKVTNLTKLELLADLSSDQGLELLVKTSNGIYYIINSTGEIIGNIVPTWNKSRFPLVFDIDSDNLNELVLFTDMGLKIFDQNSNGITWTTFRHDGYRTNNPSLLVDSEYDGLFDKAEENVGTLKSDGDTDNDMALDYTEVALMISDPLNNDTDGDHLLDGWEQFYRVNYNATLNPLNADTDNNNKTDDLEDFDNDNLTNIEEQIFGSNPMIADTDNDGLTDGFEVNNTQTDPANPDTDGDGMPDGYEYEKGFNPLNATDGGLDPDDDGLNNTLEYLHETDPFNPDTDGDGMPDGYEVKYDLDPKDPDDSLIDSDSDGLINNLESSYNTNPNSNDTDGDGMPDGWEVGYGLNPTDSGDNETDIDEDGLANLKEYQLGTDPANPDTDGDGMPDGYEYEKGFNPLDSWDGDNDNDRDGLTNSMEYEYGTNPFSSDTDGDNLTDGFEVEIGSNPLVEDSDGDGLSDGEEVVIGTNPLKVDTDGDGVNDYVEFINGRNPLDAYDGMQYLAFYTALLVISSLIILYVYLVSKKRE